MFTTRAGVPLRTRITPNFPKLSLQFELCPGDFPITFLESLRSPPRLVYLCPMPSCGNRGHNWDRKDEEFERVKDSLDGRKCWIALAAVHGFGVMMSVSVIPDGARDGP